MRNLTLLFFLIDIGLLIGIVGLPSYSPDVLAQYESLLCREKETLKTEGTIRFHCLNSDRIMVQDVTPMVWFVALVAGSIPQVIYQLLRRRVHSATENADELFQMTDTMQPSASFQQVMFSSDRQPQVFVASSGTSPGVNEFDERLINYIIDNFKREEGIDLRQDQQALERVRSAIQRAKQDLSPSLSIEINLPFIAADANGPKHLKMTLSPSKIEEIAQDFTKQMMEGLQQGIFRMGGIEIRFDQLSQMLVNPQSIDLQSLIKGSMQQLEDAYKAGLIVTEEYDRIRKKLLEKGFGEDDSST